MPLSISASSTAGPLPGRPAASSASKGREDGAAFDALVDAETDPEPAAAPQAGVAACGPRRALRGVASEAEPEPTDADKKHDDEDGPAIETTVFVFAPPLPTPTVLPPMGKGLSPDDGHPIRDADVPDATGIDSPDGRVPLAIDVPSSGADREARLLVDAQADGVPYDALALPAELADAARQVSGSFGPKDLPPPVASAQAGNEPLAPPPAVREDAARFDRPSQDRARGAAGALPAGGLRPATVLRFPSRDSSAAEPLQAERQRATPSTAGATQHRGPADTVRPTLMTWAAPPERRVNDALPHEAHATPASADASEPLRAALDHGASLGADARGDQRRAATMSAPAAARVVQVVQAAAGFDLATGAARISNGSGSASASIPNEAGNAMSIVQAIRLQSQNGGGRALVNLDPEYLGPVTIALRVENGTVTATVHAEQAQVRSWLEANEPLLRQGLADQGLALDRLLVSEERPTEDRGFSDGRRRQEQQEPPDPPRKFPRSDSLTTFDVVV